MTIGLMTIAEGKDYAPFVQRWWDSVIAMNPLPDEVIVVIGRDDAAGTRNVITDEALVRLVVLDEPFSNNYFTEGVKATTSEWVGFCGVDDMMLPRAYSEVQYATALGAEIMVGSVLLNGEKLWRGSWNPSVMHQYNPLPAHSPFRKELWERVGGFPDLHWSDWGFWLKCATQNPSVYQAVEPTAIFDTGEGRETMSGVGLDTRKRIEADQELRDFAASLQS